MEIFAIQRRSSLSPSFIEKHGIEKFFAENERKKAENQNRLLHNRISKLVKEEELVKQKCELAIKRAEELNKSKEHHLLLLQEKYNEKLKKMQKEDELRKKNLAEQKQRKENIQKMNNKLLKGKQNGAKEIKNQSELHESLYRKYLNLVRAQNMDKANKLKEDKRKLFTDRSQSQIANKNSLREEYLRIIEDHKNEYIKAMNQQSDLAKLEAELLEKLSNTKSYHLKTLESITNSQNFRSLSCMDHSFNEEKINFK